MGAHLSTTIAEGEVGKVGVAIDTVEDMKALFDGIPLDQVSTSMTINAPAALLLLMYQLVGAEQGVAGDTLTGTIQNDVLKEYIARGTYIFPPAASLRLVSDIFAYCRREIPRWNMISISGYHMAEAGATPVQEVAFTLANAREYVRAALSAGLDVDEFAPRLSFFFVARTTILEEVAKFRAARRIWAHMMRDEFGARNPKSQMLRFHTQTAGVQLTAQQPEVNLVRVTVQALAAVLGGTQSLHTNSYDEAIALPTEKAARLALRTQQVLAYETDVTRTVDPFAGSYAIESLTDEVEEATRDLMRQVEEGHIDSAMIDPEMFSKHLQNVHKITEAATLERTIEERRQGSNCTKTFWCGICNTLQTIATADGSSVSNQRFDHIDNHFMGRNGLMKVKIDEWKHMEDQADEIDHSTSKKNHLPEVEGDVGRKSKRQRAS
jgi:methylmalonyl-CoA mutase N-terminal domain/subunit